MKYFDEFYTVESVTSGHPDKICDQISDAILDAMFEQDPNSRVAVECLTTTGLVIIAGEVTTEATIDVQDVARKTIKKIGYDNPKYGFDFDNFTFCNDKIILNNIIDSLLDFFSIIPEVLIFNHDFAKAFFGEKVISEWDMEYYHKSGGLKKQVITWEYYLQQMVK